jgi:membrane fusion protein, adhesin transport system
MTTEPATLPGSSVVGPADLVAPTAPKARQVGIPTAVSADLLRLPSWRHSGLLLALIALVIGFVVWTSLANIAEVTTGHGRIIPASRIQVVQNLEGGIVRDILVREGDLVRAGDVLARIDPTIAGSSLGESREKMLGLMAVIARFEAEINDKPIEFPAELADQRADLITHQRDHYEARRRELEAAMGVLDRQHRQRQQEILEADAKIGTLKRSLDISKEELELVRKLERSKAASRSEVLTLESKVNDLMGALEGTELALPRLRAAAGEVGERRAEKLAAFKGEALQRLASARVDMAALAEASRSGADKVARTTITAPTAGIVKTVNISTRGQIIQPGHNLMEIVPLNETLLVEAQVRPQDIAFLRPGQAAKVKISAYDPSIYGALNAHIEQIGADSVSSEKGETYYLIRARTDLSYLQYRDQQLPIIPGMVADVDIVTGSKSIMTYLTKPMTRIRDGALRER